MFNFKDFTIKVTKAASGSNPHPSFEPLEETMIRMNAWIEENDITVLNVETVLMPNIFDNPNSRTSANGAYKMVPKDTYNKDWSTKTDWWYQIFRVWYQ